MWIIVWCSHCCADCLLHSGLQATSERGCGVGEIQVTKLLAHFGECASAWFSWLCDVTLSAPGLAFWHLLPNSAKTDYATDGALFISMHASTATLSAPSERFQYLEDWQCESSMVSKHTCKHEVHLPLLTNEFHLSWNSLGFIRSGINNVDSYKRNVWYNLSCLLQTYCCLSTTRASFQRPMV